MTEMNDRPSDAAPYFTGHNPEGRIGTRSSTTEGTIARYGYLTPQEAFGDVERGNPLPYTLPLETRRAVGLERETWRLEIVPDPESNSVVERPFSKELGTALDFEGLLRLGQVHGVQFLKGLSCNNVGEPLGMGLWEGVPLRVLVWMTQPVENIRRVYYHGYHNDDPEQMFRSSLPLGRVLEDPPGELPVIVCYKLNGEYLTGRRGGPVRMVVPEAYGFKSVKWLQRVVLTNHYAANDTYEKGNNDLDSPMKTFARVVSVPTPARAGEPFTISGLAQVGQSGLAKVQYAIHPMASALPGDDPTYAQADWRDATVLPPPEHWGGDLPDGTLSGTPFFFNADGTPDHWPQRYTIVHWQAAIAPLSPGEYQLLSRSIDVNGVAQPMPRPFPKSGRVAIQTLVLQVR